MTNSVAQAGLFSNFLYSLILAASLYKVWSMLNGLQIVADLLLLNSKSPGNVIAFNIFVADLASFAFIDVSGWTQSYMRLPEAEPLPFALANGGIESPYIKLEL